MTQQPHSSQSTSSLNQAIPSTTNSQKRVRTEELYEASKKLKAVSSNDDEIDFDHNENGLEIETFAKFYNLKIFKEVPHNTELVPGTHFNRLIQNVDDEFNCNFNHMSVMFGKNS